MSRRPRPSTRQNRTENPLYPEGAERPQGAGPLALPVVHALERGTIIDVDADGHIYRVALNSGRTVPMARMRTHPGDLTLLPIHTAVVVSWSLGSPYIIGVLPPEVAVNEGVTPGSITDTEGHGGNDPVLQRPLGTVARAPDEPRDVLPGDFVGLGPDGASIAALRGKIAQLRGGPLAKVITHGGSDLVQIIAGLLQTVTWMGESKVSNDGGKVSFSWRGGTDQLTQTGPDERRYTVRLDVGHVGDIILLEVCNRDGQAVFRFHVDATGGCELFAAGGWNQHGGSAASDTNPTRFYGRREVEVAGESFERVSGNTTIQHQASRTEQIHDDLTVATGGDVRADVTGNRTTGVGGNDNLTVAGNQTTTVSGDCTTNVRENHGYAVNTASGDQTFTPRSGKFKVATNNAGAIELGENPRYFGVMYEMMQQQLMSWKQQIDANFTLIANHVHPSNGAPSPVLPPLSNPTTLDLSPAKCETVKLS
jgi:hypothetical protein